MTPARLHKEQDTYSCKFSDKMEAWCLRHANILFILLLIILMTLFLALIYAITGVAALESGSMRNFINGGYI